MTSRTSSARAGFRKGPWRLRSREVCCSKKHCNSFRDEAKRLVGGTDRTKNADRFGKAESKNDFYNARSTDSALYFDLEINTANKPQEKYIVSSFISLDVYVRMDTILADYKVSGVAFHLLKAI